MQRSQASAAMAWSAKNASGMVPALLTMHVDGAELVDGVVAATRSMSPRWRTSAATPTAPPPPAVISATASSRASAVDVAGHHLGAEGGATPGEQAAEAAGGAGDDDDSSVRWLMAGTLRQRCEGVRQRSMASTSRAMSSLR